ncbi:unnamed protein product [Rhizophagus irregularis]|nr:unnamed protein product [Rhizophagus irregularis]
MSKNYEINYTFLVKFKQKEIKGEDITVLAILQYIETFNPEVSFTGTINNVKIDSTSLLNDLFATLVKEAKKFNRITVSAFDKIYKAANISDFLSSLSEFVDDLINVINACWWVTAGTGIEVLNHYLIHAERTS